MSTPGDTTSFWIKFFTDAGIPAGKFKPVKLKMISFEWLFKNVDLDVLRSVAKKVLQTKQEQ